MIGSGKDKTNTDDDGADVFKFFQIMFCLNVSGLIVESE